MNQPRVAIVGGGVTGLTVAYRLRSLLGDDVRVTLFERSRRFGGLIVTVNQDGFVVEGGPDSFLTRKPEAEALCRELGLGDDLIPTNSHNRRAFLAKGSRLHELPEGMTGLVPAKPGPLFRSGCLSVRGKLRLLLESFVAPYANGKEESIRQFFERRFGAEAFDRLIEPLVSGIFAGDPDELSIAAVLPQLVELEREYGSVLRGLRLADSNLGERRPAFLSLRRGMTGLIDTLREHCRSVDLRLDTSVAAIEKKASGYSVRIEGEAQFDADVVVVAAPAHAAASVISSMDEDVASRMAGIRFVSTATISLAYAGSSVGRPLNATGYLIPRVEGRAALGCSFSSAKFAGRAPDGRVLVRVFLGRAGQEVDATLSDEQLVDVARAEVECCLRISERPIASYVFRYPNGMPQYNIGHRERVAGIERAARKHPGLLFCGNCYDGVGISDSIRTANDAAHAAAEIVKGFSRGLG